MIPQPPEGIADFAAAELPRILWVELTSKCPFDCIFCSRRLRRGAGEHLDFEVYKSLMRELEGPEIIRLNYSGESLHYPYLIQAIELARATGAQTELVSAFSTAPDSLIEELVRSGLDRLTISLHTMRADQFEEIYRFGSLADLRSRVSRLMEIKRDFGSRTPQLDFAFVAMRANLGELSSVASYARETEVHEISVLPVIRRDPIPFEFRDELKGGELRESFKEELEQAVALARHVARGVNIRICSPEMEPEHCLGPRPRSFPGILPPGAMIRSCEQNPWETVHVLADGSVVLCEVQDRVVLGNLHRQSLREIWLGAGYRALRRRYVVGGLAECVSCPWKLAYVPSELQPGVAALESPSSQLFRGWHERDDSGTLWSKKEAVVLLASGAGAGKVRLAGALPPSTDGGDNDLEVSCNGVVLGRVVNPTNARIGFDACFDGLPRTGGPLTFALRTRTAFEPGRAGVEGDLRELGFALFRIELIE